jgi:hypothetical protein
VLQELFKAVEKSAVDAARPQPVKFELPNGVVRVYDEKGKTEDLIQLPDRQHVLGSVDQIGPFVVYHKEKRGADPVVWFNDRGVVVVLGDGVTSRRNNIASLKFNPTDEFKFVSDMANEEAEDMSARDMIKMFRRELWDAFSSESKRDSLIKLLRTVRFDDDEQGKLGTVKRSITSTADGEGDFPAHVVLSLRPFDDPALKEPFDVKCHFEVNPDTKTFCLIPIKSELKRASDDALQSLQELLVASVTCPIFRGSPD